MLCMISSIGSKGTSSLDSPQSSGMVSGRVLGTDTVAGGSSSKGVSSVSGTWKAGGSSSFSSDVSGTISVFL